MNGVLAIARNTLLQTMRRLSAMVVLLFLLLAFVVLAFFLEGDNTTTGLLRVSLTWSFSLMSGLLMLLCVALSSTVLDQEMTGGQLILTDVKPVTRGQILLGKWLGLALLFAWLLIWALLVIPSFVLSRVYLCDVFLVLCVGPANV